MITPIRGRKRIFPQILVHLHKWLEMITPIRGRKLKSSVNASQKNEIRNDNPDKGTETREKGKRREKGKKKIRNDNPDKGTETLFFSPTILSLTIRNDNPDKGTETDYISIFIFIRNSIRNDNPDKGTETFQSYLYQTFLYRLEMITPIRGRKQRTSCWVIWCR